MLARLPLKSLATARLAPPSLSPSHNALQRQPAWQIRTTASSSFRPSTLVPALASRRTLSIARMIPTSRTIHSTQSAKDIQPQATQVPHASIAAELTHPITPSPAAGPDVLDRILPTWASDAKPYLQLIRIDKPIGSVLLFWPCAWSITMASTLNHLPPSTPLFYLALFGTGAIVMRGAGCTINDMWDRKYDAAVERTKSRPLAAGTVTPFQALTFLGGQLAVGLAVLTQLNYYSIALGASSLGLVVLYPLMKRITYYPQIVMGLTFNWGALLGWSAVAGAVDWSIALPMYVTGTIWGVVYDTIYAHQDKVDDVSAGVKSMALRFPDSSRTVISTLSATVVSGLAYVGYAAGLGPAYYGISVLGAAGHLAWQCKTVDFDSRADCWSKFKANGWLGGLVWLGIAVDYVWEVVIPGKYKDGKEKPELETEGQGKLILRA